MNQSILGLTLIAALASGCSGPATPPPSGTTGGQGPATATPPAASQPGPATAATPAAPQPGASQSPAPPPAEPLAPPAPTFREVTIPADTTLTVKLETPLASDKSQVEDTVRGTLAKPIVIAGETVVPAGAELAGTVTESSQSGRVKGRAMVAFVFDRLTVVARATGSRRRASHARLRPTRKTTSRRARSAPAPAPSSAASRAAERVPPSGPRLAERARCSSRKERKSGCPSAARSVLACGAR